MKKTYCFLSLLTLVLVSSSMFSCTNETNSAGELNPTESSIKDLVISELMYEGTLNDVALEISSTKENSNIDLSKVSLEIYDDDNLVTSIKLSNTLRGIQSYVLFNNSKIDKSLNSSNAYTLDLEDDYLRGDRYYVLKDNKDVVIDCLGYKGVSVIYCEIGKSIVRFNEVTEGQKKFNILNYYKKSTDLKTSIGNFNNEMTKNDMLSGMKFDSPYTEYNFLNENGFSAEGGYVHVELGKLVDGDTTYFTFPESSNLSENYTKVRYLFINTPEISHSSTDSSDPYGDEAKEFTNNILKSAKGFIVQSVIGSIYDTYGRVLGIVYYTLDDDLNDLTKYRCLNFEVIKEGLARLMTMTTGDEMIYRSIRYVDYFQYASNYCEFYKINLYSK